MKIRIAVAGELPDSPQLYGKIDILIGQISGYMSRSNTNADIQIMVSPMFTGENWITWNQTHNFEMCTFNAKNISQYNKYCTYIRDNDTPIRNIISEEMCCKADIVLAVWDEEVAEQSGATWDFLQRSYNRKTPCIWISTKTNQTHCLWDSYYGIYNAQYLADVLEPLPVDELKAESVDETKDFLLSFWERRRRSYLKKHKAENNIYPSTEDALLKKEFTMEKDVSGGEAIRQRLLAKFYDFDTAAIELNTRFQAMLYQRSVLPFLASVIIAFGFYMSLIDVFPLSFTRQGTLGKIILDLIAGISFLLHACLNLYVYQLSKSKKILRWQTAFVRQRYTAELLRVLLHFKPYGIELNLKKLCPEDKKLYMQIKHLTDDIEPKTQDNNKKTTRYVMQHLHTMLLEQLAYHEASINRYKSIVKSLEKWGGIALYLGFIMVVARGFVQFGIVVYEYLAGTVVNKWGSFFNMLAMLFPAWASYFALKTQQNNFRYNYNNHKKMSEKLGKMLERVENLLKQDEIPLEVLGGMAEELAELMLNEDTAEWTYQYMNSTIKPL